MSFEVTRRKLVALILSGFAACGAIAAATASNANAQDNAKDTQSAEFAQALNVAGRQRMLSQRVVKAYALMGVGNENSSARAQLYEAVELFERQLAELSALAAHHHQLRTPVDALARAWKSFDALATAEVRRDKVAALLDEDDRLLNACQAVVDVLRALSGSRYSRLVDTAGRQRMLSQRLAKAYVLMAWGIEDDRISDTFISAWNEFEEALSWMLEARLNTAGTVADLELAQQQWSWMKSAMGLHSQDSYFPDIVDDASEKILALMERITNRYEQLMRQSIS